MAVPQTKAQQLKQEGNEAFKNDQFLKAAGLYTKAIKEDPENVLLYSNRCAALLKLSKISKAFSDADRVISMRPEWEKGYFRKASIFEAQEQYEEALQWYKRAAECNGNAGREFENKLKNLSRLVKTQKTKNASTKTSVTPSNGRGPSSFSFDAAR